MGSNIGLNLESSEDNDEDSNKEETDWGMIFMLLKQRGFSHEEILNLSYPVFNAYMKNINNKLTFNVVIPYMGDGKEDKEAIKRNAIEMDSKEELLGLIADMNKGW